MFTFALTLTSGALLLVQPAAAAQDMELAVPNPPASTTWWYAKGPGPGAIVGVRRHGPKIQFVDNWAPCFTGQRIRPYVYKGGGLNQNAYYSRQKMKIWVEGTTLHTKRAFVGFERLPDVPVMTYRSISAAKAKRLLVPVGVPPSKYFADCTR